MCSVFFVFSDYFFMIKEIFISCFPVTFVKTEQIRLEHMLIEEIRRI